MQKKSMISTRNEAIVGVMVGAAVGMMTKMLQKPKKRKFAQKAGKAIGAVGEVMQNVSSYMR